MAPRKYRVLHIGNVANYAFNISNILQTERIESHAINWDYYHIGSRPEWEEADFDPETIGNHFFPSIPRHSKNSFIVPAWYSHGRMKTAALYLIAKNENKWVRAWIIRKICQRYLEKIADKQYRATDRLFGGSELAEGFCMDMMDVGRFNTLRALLSILRRVLRAGAGRLSQGPQAIVPDAAPPVEKPSRTKAGSAKNKKNDNAAEKIFNERELPQFRVNDPLHVASSDGVNDADLSIHVTKAKPDMPSAADLIDAASGLPLDPNEDYEKYLIGLIMQYKESYPNRRMGAALLKQFESSQPLMKRLFASYDVVIGYGIEGIWPLMGRRPYMAYEFGTIRNLPFQNDDMGKLAFLTYRNAGRTIVTNHDNQIAAEALRLNYFFLPHIINESAAPLPDEATAFRRYLQDFYGGDFFVFHPPRQHWSEKRDTNWEKGNDLFYRGFARFVKEIGPNARCISVDWGESVEASRTLIRLLGIEDNCVWIKPQPHHSMMRFIAACDATADQFNVPSFGGIPPKAFFLGKPVISAFDPALHAWCYDRMPPFPPARSASAIFETLSRLYRDPEYGRRLGEDGRAWYEAYNSNFVIRRKLEGEVLAFIADQERRADKPPVPFWHTYRQMKS